MEVVMLADRRRQSNPSLFFVVAAALLLSIFALAKHALEPLSASAAEPTTGQSPSAWGLQNSEFDPDKVARVKPIGGERQSGEFKITVNKNDESPPGVTVVFDKNEKPQGGFPGEQWRAEFKFQGPPSTLRLGESHKVTVAATYTLKENSAVPADSMQAALVTAGLGIPCELTAIDDKPPEAGQRGEVRAGQNGESRVIRRQVGVYTLTPKDADQRTIELTYSVGNGRVARFTYQKGLRPRPGEIGSMIGEPTSGIPTVPLPERDPREVDAFLDDLGMLLAFAAAAPPPRYGIVPVQAAPSAPQSRRIGDPLPNSPFTWVDAVDMAHTVHMALIQLQHEAAGRRYNVRLTRAQLRRMKAFGHWVNWIYERNTNSWDWYSSGFFLTAPDRPPTANIPAPPPYPLNGPIDEKFGDIAWPWPGGGIRPQDVIDWEAKFDGVVGTGFDVSILASQVVLNQFKAGRVFLLMGTGAYGAYGKNLTPLAWQVFSMLPLKYNNLTGSGYMALFNLGEALTGQEVQLRLDLQRWWPLTTAPLSPAERIGKFSLAVLLGSQEYADAKEITRITALSRAVKADLNIPPNEGAKFSLVPIHNPRPVEGHPDTVLMSLDIIQPTLQKDKLTGSGDILVSSRVWKVGEGAEAYYLNPDTGEPLFFLGQEGYHAYKHFYERYPFGFVERVQRVTSKTDPATGLKVVGEYGEVIPEARWNEFFDKNTFRVKGEVNRINPLTGKPLTANTGAGAEPPDMPGLRDLFFDHPQLKDRVKAFDDAFHGPPAERSKRMNEAYLQLINSIITVFKNDSTTFLGHNPKYHEDITGHVIQHKGMDVYIILSSKGRFMNAMVLGNDFEAQEIWLNYMVQRGIGSESNITSRMRDMAEMVLPPPDSVWGKPYPLREPLKPLDEAVHRAIVIALREDALRVFSLGGAAFREKEER
jgi:hypothetical protein